MCCYTKYGIFMSETKKIKRLDFVGASREALSGFPEAVKEDIGYALFLAQRGEMPGNAKPLKGFGGAGVLEVLEDFRGGAYRAVYTVKFADVIYVLHCFQKKSRQGIKTPLAEMELVRSRLKVAEEDYRMYYSGGR